MTYCYDKQEMCRIINKCINIREMRQQRKMYFLTVRVSIPAHPTDVSGLRSTSQAGCTFAER